MKNVIKIILRLLHKFWEINSNIILFILYIIIFFPYKILFISRKWEDKKWWEKVEKYNINNKFLPY